MVQHSNKRALDPQHLLSSINCFNGEETIAGVGDESLLDVGGEGCHFMQGREGRECGWVGGGLLAIGRDVEGGREMVGRLIGLG